MPVKIELRTRYSIDDFARQYASSGLGRGKVRLEVLNSLRSYSTRVRQRLDRTTEDWENHTVSFKLDSRQTKGGSNVGVTIEAVGFGAEIWRYLDQGTTIKYGFPADPNNYSPKTRPRIFSSGFGQGRWVFNINAPSDGVIAREWAQTIADDPIMEQFFVDDLEDRMGRLIARLGL